MPMPSMLVRSVNAGSLLAQFESCLAAVHAGEVATAMNACMRLLLASRQGSTAAEWRELVPLLRGHALFYFVQQSPFTRRAYEKPRGYPGDAATLDFIY